MPLPAPARPRAHGALPWSSAPTELLLVTAGEAPLTRCQHPGSPVYPGFSLGVPCAGLDTCVMMRLCPYVLAQSGRPALKALSTPPVHPSSPANPGNH